MRTVEIKSHSLEGSFEVTTTETKTIAVVFSMDELKADLKTLQNRRDIDQASFDEAMSKIDAKISEIQSLILQAETMIVEKQKDLT